MPPAPNGVAPTATRDAAVAMKDADTVTGRLFYYGEAGSAVKPVQLQRFENGAFHCFGIVGDKAVIAP